MTSTHGVLRRFKPLWLSAWPLWTLLVFASLAAARLLPEGYARAAVAAPILLMVPGSLTLGAVFSQRRRPQGVVFVCYAALLSAVWSAFASLALYVLGVLITADSTYWCLLGSRLCWPSLPRRGSCLGGGRGRRAAASPRPWIRTCLDTGSDDAEAPADIRGAAYYAIVAVVAGVSFLAGGLYVYDHVPHPAPAGYTWMAWTGPPIKGDIAVGSAGTELHFQIVHRQSDTTTFRLSAAWLGTPSRPLAKSLTLIIGPDQTFRGALFVPPLPDGCTYRIVVSLTAARQIDPLTKNRKPGRSMLTSMMRPNRRTSVMDDGGPESIYQVVFLRSSSFSEGGCVRRPSCGAESAGFHGHVVCRRGGSCLSSRERHVGGC